MTTTVKTVSTLLIAALLSAMLFLSPVGQSFAQDDTTEDPTEETITPDRGDRTPLTEEERATLQAERDAARQAFADDVAGQLDVTTDELATAFRTATINAINARVEAGDLDADRAAAIIERIESAEGLDGLPFGPGGRGGPGGPGGHGGHGGHHGPGGDAAAAAAEGDGI